MIIMPLTAYGMGSDSTERGSSGGERPAHLVFVFKPFAVSRYATTFDEWDACVHYGDCDPGIHDNDWGRGRQPVINVTWDDAQRYVTWLNKMIGKAKEGEGYRLLSEAEWEYAARAGTTSAYSFGYDPAMLDEYAWYSLNSGSRAHPVGEKKPNEFRLYDMHGNVWSWVEDCRHANYQGAPTNGSAWHGEDGGDCGQRIFRGGSWFYSAPYLRSAKRAAGSRGIRINGVGFRVARTLKR